MSLEQLKQIRVHRVRRAYTELQRKKSILSNTEQELIDARSQLENYHEWRLQHEKELFEELQNDFFSPDQLQDYNLMLEKLKEKERQLRDVIPVVEKQLQDAQQEVAAAQQRLHQVSKDKEKVDEFLQIEQDEAKAIIEKQEENLADEISCHKSSLT